MAIAVRVAWLVPLLLLAGCASPPPPAPTVPPTFTATGALDLSHYVIEGTEGEPCTGDGGYDDIREGAQVKISDDAGKVVALGQLEAGVTKKTSELPGTQRCVFSFTVPDVPDGKIFGVEVTHRGVIQFSRDQAGSIVLTLG